MGAGDPRGVRNVPAGARAGAQPGRPQPAVSAAAADRVQREDQRVRQVTAAAIQPRRRSARVTAAVRQDGQQLAAMKDGGSPAATA